MSIVFVLHNDLQISVNVWHLSVSFVEHLLDCAFKLSNPS